MVKGHDFIQSAFDLKKQDTLSEIDLRNITSRSYYGAYHCCLDLAQSYSIKLANGATHKKLTDALIAHGNKEIRKIGNQLLQCHKCRVAADYYLNITYSERDMRMQLRKTKQVVDAITQMLESKTA